MYKLLVVDDEVRDRNIVRILIEKQYPGVFQLLEASSGTQALDILHADQIDLMLLDLNMPGISGIGVVREIQYSTYVIVLTAYSFFDYAREALHYGVKDYVLKPPIRSELYGTIDRFLEVSHNQIETQSRSNRALAKELATQMLFYGNTKKIKEYRQILGIHEEPISLAVLLTSNMPDSSNEQMLPMLERILNEQLVQYVTAAFRTGTAVLFFGESSDNFSKIRTCLSLLKSQINCQLEYELNLESCEQIPRTFIRLCDLHPPVQPAAASVTPSENVERAIREQGFAQAMQLMTDEVERWDYASNSDAVKFQLVSLLSTSTKHLFANADKRGAYVKLSTLLGSPNKEMLLNATAEYLHWLIGEIQKSVYTNSYVVHRVIDAVKLNCANNWTMEGFAADLKISPYYLSHLFKEYTGNTFTDYLAEYRIERSIELMKQPEFSLAQIGEMVGYADQNYFSRVFKKRRGIGARQFRKQLLSE